MSAMRAGHAGHVPERRHRRRFPSELSRMQARQGSTEGRLEAEREDGPGRRHFLTAAQVVGI